MLRIAHLVDDQSAGGVTRYLSFISGTPGMAALARHQIVPVSRTRPASVHVKADLIVSHLAITWRGLPGLIALRARHAGTPLVHVEHSYSEGFTAANVPARARFFTLLRCSYALFDRIVAVSEGQGDWLTRRGLVQPDALTVIRPTVDLSGFRALPAPEGRLRHFGAIGRFDRQKGFDLLIQAFRDVPGDDLRLTLYGDGPERTRLEALAAGDVRIQFAGFAPDPVRAMRQCDVIAMPSRWEPFGIAASEARAARRPLLVSGVDGLADHVRLGAIRVNDPSVEGWTAALQRLAGAQMPTSLPPRRIEEQATIAGWRNLLGDLLAGGDPIALQQERA
ncbi:glycosyltransferase [Oceanicola sp. S124]|uniref:glycosyltransferase n=1 Tax=Oceanicola sp. S124 TaxID=1042378 RepID=UPI0002559388|nr:glycosyltransferase [Oceanicola sp. S124]